MDATKEELRARRAAALEAEGGGAHDVLHVGAACACAGPRWTATALHPDPFPGLEALEADLAARAAAPAPACAGCGGPLRPFELERHLHASALGKDLVLRRAGGEAAKVWWDPTTGHEAQARKVIASELRALERDATARHLAGRLAVGDGAGFLAAFAAAARALPGDPAWLLHLPDTLGLGEPGAAVAREVLAAHRASGKGAAGRRQAEVEARVAAAGLEVEAVRRGLAGPEALAAARDEVEAALAVDPDHLEAALLRANALHLAADPAARAAYEQVVARHPGCAEALHDLGLFDLEADPAAALARFEAAAAAAPDDADHPVGAARALLRLGRLDDAGAALERARALDADHPRLGQLDHELRRRTGREPKDGPRVVVEVVGLDAFGDAYMERGVVPLGPAGDEAERLRQATWDLCCALRVVDGSALCRDPQDGRPLRLWRVSGDGRCVELAPHDDADAVADFVEEFAALWAEVEAQGLA